MLTYESLIDEAKSRGMPQTKTRGILREYLQILIMKEISRDKLGKKLLFTGGTYLRLIHNLKRFSEDLDFNTNVLTKNTFETLIKNVASKLEKQGINLKVRHNHWGRIYVSKLIFPEIENFYNIVSKYSRKHGIIIKIESNKPKCKINIETQMISGFGEFYPCVCTDKSVLFADKLDALEKKRRARHIYDIIFMLSNKYTFNKQVLKSLGIKQDPLIFLSNTIKSFPNIELKKQALSLRPFLFDEKEADLISNASEIIPLLIAKYK
jgi:predicted nucleotidyltransferase component of viral defense system